MTPLRRRPLSLVGAGAATLPFSTYGTARDERNGPVSVAHDFDHDPFVPEYGETVSLSVTADHDEPLSGGAVYYTTDGSAPAGRTGDATGNGSAVELRVDASEDGESVLTGSIPAQENRTRVKYLVVVWTTEGESFYADANARKPEEATEFAYYVGEHDAPDWAHDASVYHVFVDRML